MKKEECFFLGIISKKHGYKGYVNIKLDVNNSKKYKELDYLLIDLNGNLVPFFINSLRFKNNNIALVKFEDVKDEDSANSLIGKYLPNNNSGLFTIAIQPGKYKLKITASGYEPVIKDFNVSTFAYDKEIIRLTHLLKPKDNDP